MLNTFPGLLLPFLAPTFLRVGLAIVFAAIAYVQWRRRDEISKTDMVVIGRGTWWVWLSIAVHLAVALMLVFGYYTQIAAIMGASLSLKHAFWSHRYPRIFPLGRAAGFLMLLISLSLILSGAGAFAQDLPL
jgi:uncharacterized membrane protein YphA (DoxX/SURF4 family)